MCHGAKGPGSKQNYPCHLNIQLYMLYFNILLFTLSDILTSPSENKNVYHKSQNYPSMTIFINWVYTQSYLMLPT